MLGDTYIKEKCVYCHKDIDGCCYPVYEGTVKVGYRHIHCYPEGSFAFDNEVPFGHVLDDNGELD